MKRIATCFVLLLWLLPAAGAGEQPARGKLLVATELVGGAFFAETVILLLNYDENGAMGIVVNRPTDVAVQDAVDDVDELAWYTGELFWGGPVQMDVLHALLRTDDPPEGVRAVVGSVYYVNTDEGLQDAPADEAGLRFFIGYAGWSAGQLDGELERGSWHVVPASDEAVFAEDPDALWKQLSPPVEHTAGLQASRSVM